MFNIIKMNLYRLFRQKAFYIIPISTAIMCCLMVYLIWLTPRMENLATDSGFHIAVGPYGSNGIEPLPITEEFKLTEFIDEIFGSGMLMIFISIAAAIITNAEQKNGFIKNVAGQISSRGMLTVAKLPGMMLECILVLAATVFSCALAGRLLFSSFTLGSLSALAGALAVQLMLAFGFCSLILMICTLAGNAASGIITGIALSAGIMPLVYTLINKVLWTYLHVPESFDITRCFLSTHLMSISTVSDTKTLTLGFVVGAVYLVACSAGAFVIITRKDIV